jgi:hypothetical protein
MADALIAKYNALFEALALPTSWTGAPAFIAQVMSTILPQIMADVGTLSNMTGDQKKQMVIDITTAGLNAAFTQLGSHVNMSSDQWNNDVKSYIDPLITQLIDTFVSVNNGQIQFSGGSKFLQWLCPCMKA